MDGHRTKNRDVNRDNVDKNSKEETNRFHSVLSRENVRNSYEQNEEDRGVVIEQKTMT